MNKKITKFIYLRNGQIPLKGYVEYSDGSYASIDDKSELTNILNEVRQLKSKDKASVIFKPTESNTYFQNVVADELALNYRTKEVPEEATALLDKYGNIKKVGAVVGAAVVGGAATAGVINLVNNGQETKIAATAESEDESQASKNGNSNITVEEARQKLSERLALKDAQIEFLDVAEETIDKYNSLCDKYNLTEDFKIGINEFLSAYVNYNDLSDSETQELMPMFIKGDSAEPVSIQDIETFRQSFVSKFLGMSVVMTDTDDIHIFDGFIQNITGSMTENEVELDPTLTPEQIENKLSNLKKSRRIMSDLLKFFVDSNNSGKLCGDDFAKFVTDTINNEVGGITTGSALYAFFGDIYETCGGIHSAGLDEKIIVITHEQRSYDDSTQANKNELSVSDSVVTHENKVCGSISDRIIKAVDNQKKWHEETLEMMKKAELETNTKYYVNSEYNEEYNKLLEKYKNIELFNVNDDKKADLLQKVVNDFLHSHGRSFVNAAIYTHTTGSFIQKSPEVTKKEWTEPAPANDIIFSDKVEQMEIAKNKIAEDPSLSTTNADGSPMTQEQADDWIAKKEAEAAKPPEVVNKPDGTTIITDTVKNDDGSYTTKEEIKGSVIIDTPVDGEIKDEAGNVVKNEQSAPTGDPETAYVKDKIQQSIEEAQNQANAPVDSTSTPTPDVSTNTPVDNNPTPDVSADTPVDNITPEVPSDNNVSVEVGDFVPLENSSITETYDAPAPVPVEEVYVAPAPAPVEEVYVAPAPAPVEEVYVASEPAPVEEVYVASEPAPVEKNYVEQSETEFLESNGIHVNEDNTVSVVVDDEILTFDENGDIVDASPVEASVEDAVQMTY